MLDTSNLSTTTCQPFGESNTVTFLSAVLLSVTRFMMQDNTFTSLQSTSNKYFLVLCTLTSLREVIEFSILNVRIITVNILYQTFFTYCFVTKFKIKVA